MTFPTSEDERWIARCLDLAREAASAEEVPVGAIVVLDGEILGVGRNRVEERRSPLAHAEMEALQSALAKVGEKRLPEAGQRLRRHKVLVLALREVCDKGLLLRHGHR